MKRFTLLKLVCGLSVAVVVTMVCSKHAIAWPNLLVIRPITHHHMTHHHGHAHVVRPIVVVRPSLYRPALSPPIVVANPAPVVVVSNPAPIVLSMRNIAVVNPQGTGATLNFTVDGARCELAPGMRQELSSPQTRLIEFDRGGSFGQARYTLSEGLYSFAATDKGWDLIQAAYRPAEAQNP